MKWDWGHRTGQDADSKEYRGKLRILDGRAPFHFEKARPIMKQVMFCPGRQRIEAGERIRHRTRRDPRLFTGTECFAEIRFVPGSACIPGNATFPRELRICRPASAIFRWFRDASLALRNADSLLQDSGPALIPNPRRGRAFLTRRFYLGATFNRSHISRAKYSQTGNFNFASLTGSPMWMLLLQSLTTDKWNCFLLPSASLCCPEAPLMLTDTKDRVCKNDNRCIIGGEGAMERSRYTHSD